MIANPTGNKTLEDHRSAGTTQPAELPMECAWPSTRSIPALSFGAPPDDRMSNAALEGELKLSGEVDLAVLLSSGM